MRCLVTILQIQRDTGLWYWAEYTIFSITDESDAYRLTVDGYSGDAGNALRHPSWDANGMQFSTWDVDHDLCGVSISCALSHMGGWWYACCSYSYINKHFYTRWQGAGNGAENVQASRMLIRIAT